MLEQPWKDAGTVWRGYELNYKLRVLEVQNHSGDLPPVRSFVSVNADNVVLTAVKASEDGDDLVLRFYEWAGLKTAVCSWCCRSQFNPRERLTLWNKLQAPSIWPAMPLRSLPNLTKSKPSL